ncbi:MAG: hypothetical protein AMXMBFR34_33020 [Myxococcaceae bacterium]
MRWYRRPLALALVCLTAPVSSLAAAPLTTCALPEKAKLASSKTDAKAREAAHKGFTWLAKASIAWTKQYQCFGCHVQAVTMEALTAARHHQYDVDPKDLAAMVDALNKGVTAGGRTTGAAFEGAAWARYDKYVDDKHTKALLQYADELMTLQAETGAINDDDARLPITGGTMQTTFQAAQAWRQAYARTANDRYLAPLRKAERFLTRTSDSWKTGQAVYVQDISFALLGLASAGVTRSEEASVRLQKLLLARQNTDGGWGLDPKKSDAFATGQVLYTLKVAGFSDSDDVVQKGLAYLLSKQSADGSWRTVTSGQHGSEKGETMWGVLALVTVDVASVAVKGLTDGQHVSGKLALDTSAVDNQSGGITELSLFIDDVKTANTCGPKLTYGWDTSGLKPGKHLVDVVAVNAKGRQSRRRFEVYAGDVFLTEVGATFDEGTQRARVTARNIADPKHEGTVAVEIWSVDEKSEAPKARVFTTEAKGQAGATELTWDGRDEKKTALPRGRYLAKVQFKDKTGAVRQTESSLFLLDSDRVQRETYGEVEGALKLGNLGGMGSANTSVDLVDDKGQVVQSVTSTEQGNYRFKNVKPGKYTVRARKDGYKELEAPAPVSTGAAAPTSKVDFNW